MVWIHIRSDLLVTMLCDLLKRFVSCRSVVKIVSATVGSDDGETAHLVAVDLSRMDLDQPPLPSFPYFGAGATESAHMPVSIFYHQRQCGFPVSSLVISATIFFLMWLGGATRKCASLCIDPISVLMVSFV